MEINRDYPCNEENYQRGRAQPVSYLVLHYVGALGGSKANASYYCNTPGIEASAHYFVGHASEGAVVYASVPEGDTAWHVGAKKYKHPQCRNANSIGIEMCCHQDALGRWYIDPETVDRTVELSREIMARHHIPRDHVLRHFDVTGKFCPMPWVEDPKAWETFKARLEEIDMTKEEARAIAEEVVRAFQPKIYTDLAQVPLWAQGLVERAVGAGVIKGDGAGKLNLTDQDLKTLSMLDGVGLIKGGG